MRSETNQKRARAGVEVEVHLDDGSQLLGKLGVAQGERVSDLMNDQRQFLPVETSTGNIVILRKAVIAKVVPLDQHMDKGKGKATDPYEILGIPRNINDEDLNRSYRRLSVENHPDKLQASGLSSDFVEMATSRMIRINDAYHRIRSMRYGGAASTQKSDGGD